MKNMAVEILLSVAVLLIFAKIFGEIAERLKLPSLVGEVFGGLAAGLLNFVQPHPLLADLAGLGLLFIAFLIGLRMNGEEIKGSAPAVFLGAAGTLLSFVLGFAAGYYFYGFAAGIAAGAALVSTSSTMSSRAMSSVGELHSKAGRLVAAVNVFDDAAAIIALSTMAAYFTFSESWKVTTIFFSLSLLMIVLVLFLSRYTGRLAGMLEEMNNEQFTVSAALVLVFLLSFASQSAGISAAPGAFAAGLLLSKSPLRESVIEPKIRTVSYGFFAPLFFAYLALSLAGVNVSFVVALLLLAAAAKFVGSGLLSRYYGFRGHEQFTTGTAMMPRGEITLIAAYIALTSAVISAQVFTALVITALLTIVATSALFHFFVKRW